jgi:hypothetical protein
VISVSADSPTVRLVANLNPLHEVPAVSSPGSGRFTALVNGDESIDYEISWQDLQAPVTQSHIHFAQPNVNGAVVVWLCGTATNPGPAGTQACPAGTSGTVSGTILPANVIAATTQGISAGDFAEVVRAMGLGVAYANVHSTGSPGGEVRGQIRARRGPEKDDN